MAIFSVEEVLLDVDSDDPEELDELEELSEVFERCFLTATLEIFGGVSFITLRVPSPPLFFMGRPSVSGFFEAAEGFNDLDNASDQQSFSLIFEGSRARVCQGLYGGFSGGAVRSLIGDEEEFCFFQAPVIFLLCGGVPGLLRFPPISLIIFSMLRISGRRSKDFRCGGSRRVRVILVQNSVSLSKRIKGRSNLFNLREEDLNNDVNLLLLVCPVRPIHVSGKVNLVGLLRGPQLYFLLQSDIYQYMWVVSL